MASKQTDILSYYRQTKNLRKNKFQKTTDIEVSQVTESTSGNKICTTSFNEVSKSQLQDSKNCVSNTPTGKKETSNDFNDSKIRNSKKRKREATSIGIVTPQHNKQTSITTFLNLEKQQCSAKKKLKLTNDDVLESARTNDGVKKTNPEDIKKVLGKCSNLIELKAKLLKSNNLKAKLQQFKEASAAKELELGGSPQKEFLSPLKAKSSPFKLTATVQGTKTIPPSPHKIFKERNAHPQLKHFKSLELDVPLSPAKSPAKSSPCKSSPIISRPARLRFGHLAELPVDDESLSRALTLPHKYQLIKEAFRAVDTVVSLLYNRKETITFSKLRPAVQEMLRSAFPERQLGQLKTVFPLGYFFNQEKVQTMNGSGVKESSYHLTLKPNFEYKSKAVVKNLLNEFNDSNSVCKYRKMDSVVLIERRHVFHNALLDILKKHHQIFLESLNQSVTVDNDSLTNWHPEFPLEDVKEPESSALPEPPTTDCPKTVKDLMEQTQSLFFSNNRVNSALNKAASIQDSEPKLSPEATPVIPKPEVTAALKGVSMSLLQKIRAKEAAKLAREMSRPVAVSEELDRLSRLPELAKILRNIFVTAKKAALPVDTVFGQVSQSHSSKMSNTDVEDHICLLMKELPSWCQLHKVRSGQYFKIDKNRNVNDVVSELQSIIKQRS